MNKFKPTNILQWENDETQMYAGFWGDWSNKPVEIRYRSKLIPASWKRRPSWQNGWQCRSRTLGQYNGVVQLPLPAERFVV